MPQKKDEVLRDKCNVCHKSNQAVQCSYDTHKAKFIVCTECAKPERNDTLRWIGAKHRVVNRNTCNICGKPGNDEFGRLLVFNNAPNCPYFAQVLCSPECLRQSQVESQQSLDGKVRDIMPQCRFCQRGTKDILHCGRCRGASYCSKQCQTLDWPRHKQHCQKFSQVPQVSQVSQVPQVPQVS